MYEFYDKKNSKYLLEYFDERIIFNTESNYRKWFHDPEVTKYNSHGLFPYTDEKIESFIKSIGDGKQIIFAIMYYCSYKHIGNVSLQSINMINRSAELAIIIGETNYYEKGIATAACKKMLEHGFLKLGLNRIWTGTAANNIGMKKVAEKIGMKHEGTFREGMWLNGKFEDIDCYSILKKEWECGNKL